MKTIGLMMILAFSALTGISLSFDAKKKCTYCEKLIEMAQNIRLLISYSLTDTNEIIRMLSADKELAALTFLKNYDVSEQTEISTVLSSADDERINKLFHTLGTTDADNQLNMLDAFSQYFMQRKDKYSQSYNKNRKLYAAFGICGGIAISLMLA